MDFSVQFCLTLRRDIVYTLEDFETNNLCNSSNTLILLGYSIKRYVHSVNNNVIRYFVGLVTSRII